MRLSILRSVLLGGIAAMSVSSAMAQTASSSEGSGDEVVVTGTRGQPRTAFDSLAPVDVISGNALDRTASDEIMDSLAQLAPSFNVQRLPANDGLIFVRPATLRSLSPDHTLVLVNGKRRHRSALLGSNGAQAADLAQIPSSAIERIEVLRDGASAQYGSDAIAGVINIILKDEPGLRAFGQYGQYYEGDGDQFRAGAQLGTKIGEAGFLTGTFEWTTVDATSRSRQRADAIDFQNANPDLDVPNPVQRWGQPDRDAYRFALNGEIDAGLFGVWDSDDDERLDAAGFDEACCGFVCFPFAGDAGRGVEDVLSIHEVEDGVVAICVFSVVVAGWEPDKKFARHAGCASAATDNLHRAEVTGDFHGPFGGVVVGGALVGESSDDELEDWSLSLFDGGGVDAGEDSVVDVGEVV